MQEQIRFEVTLSPDRKEVDVKFPKTDIKLNAVALDELIQVLAKFRSNMDPVPSPDYGLGQKCEAILNPRWVTEPDALQCGSLLHIRHAGLGWLHFLIPKDEATKLCGYLQAQTGQPTEPVLTKRLN